jgi:hypothetical protein
MNDKIIILVLIVFLAVYVMYSSSTKKSEELDPKLNSSVYGCVVDSTERSDYYQRSYASSEENYVIINQSFLMSTYCDSYKISSDRKNENLTIHFEISRYGGACGASLDCKKYLIRYGPLEPG